MKHPAGNNQMQNQCTLITRGPWEGKWTRGTKKTFPDSVIIRYPDQAL